MSHRRARSGWFVDVGTVTPRKYADVIAVRGDVLRHIALLRRVDIVVKHGTRYK